MISDSLLHTDRIHLNDLMGFLNESPTAEHTIEASVKRLESAGFCKLDEETRWKLEPGKKYYAIRGKTSLIAFIPGKADPGNTGFRIGCAHTDSPGLRIKPVSSFSGEGYLQVGVEIYGDPILATWFDRDLGIAGRLVIKDSNGSLSHVLFRHDEPVCRIPAEAIHMNRNVNEEGFKFNLESEVIPVCGLKNNVENDELVRIACSIAGVEKENVVSHHIELIDIQPPVVGGMNKEFIFGGCLDDHLMCHALITAIKDIKPADHTSVIALFDSEEIGSITLNGAVSTFLDEILERLCDSNDRQTFFMALAKSLQISADGAHALHPNYKVHSEKRNSPIINKGPAIKVNAKKKYATTALTSAYFRRCAESAGVPTQNYVIRNDMRSGSTIGPIISSRLGIMTVDVGPPMLSMHSIREMAGTGDHDMMISALTRHFDGSLGLPRRETG